MAADIQRVRKRGAADHGQQQARYTYEQKVAAVRAVVELGLHGGDGRVRHHADGAARLMVQALPRGQIQIQAARA